MSCKKDGVKSSETANPQKGFIEVTGGTLNITAGDDAFQAPRKITISGGSLTLSAEGKLYKCDAAGGISVNEKCVKEIAS